MDTTPYQELTEAEQKQFIFSIDSKLRYVAGFYESLVKLLHKFDEPFERAEGEIIHKLKAEKKPGEGICTGNHYDCHFLPYGGKLSPASRMKCSTCGQINE